MRLKCLDIYSRPAVGLKERRRSRLVRRVTSKLPLKFFTRLKYQKKKKKKLRGTKLEVRVGVMSGKCGAAHWPIPSVRCLESCLVPPKGPPGPLLHPAQATPGPSVLPLPSLVLLPLQEVLKLSVKLWGEPDIAFGCFPCARYCAKHFSNLMTTP